MVTQVNLLVNLKILNLSLMRVLQMVFSPEKKTLSLEEVADFLASGYPMADLEAMRGVQLELDDMPPVEMDLNEVEDPPYEDDGVIAEGDGPVQQDEGADVDNEVADGVIDEVDGVLDEVDGVIDEVDGVIAEDEGADVDNEAADGVIADVVIAEGNEADDEGQDFVTKKRKRLPSERILLQKLSKPIYDKDGGGSSSTKPVILE